MRRIILYSKEFLTLGLNFSKKYRLSLSWSFFILFLTMKIKGVLFIFLLSFSFIASIPSNLTGEGMQHNSNYTPVYSQTILFGLKANNTILQALPCQQSEHVTDAIDNSGEDFQESGIPTNMLYLYSNQSTAITCFFHKVPTKRHQLYFTGGVGW